jgi:hypothetical protein
VHSLDATRDKTVIDSIKKAINKADKKEIDDFVKARVTDVGNADSSIRDKAIEAFNQVIEAI